MPRYYATFIPGLQEFIADVIKERLRTEGSTDARIHKLLDGAVLFETETSYDKLIFFCFNNIFAVISVIENAKNTNAIERHIEHFINNIEGKEIIAANSRKFKTFRIVASVENQPAAVDEKVKIEAEKLISRLSGLKINRSLPDTEFWFLFRKEKEQGRDFSIFMKRLSLRSSWEKTLHKGELPPPLAWALCRLARLTHSDTVLDPFCGYGSIPEEAMKHFHVTNFTACDNDKKAASYTNARFKNRKKSFTLYQTDFETLPSLIAEKSIDAVVTDPPWGCYKEMNDSRFLEKMFDILAKLLKQGGRAVVLYANKEELLQALPACFSLESTIPILLSGRKAVILGFYFHAV